jgi:hypothetical protein
MIGTVLYIQYSFEMHTSICLLLSLCINKICFLVNDICLEIVFIYDRTYISHTGLSKWIFEFRKLYSYLDARRIGSMVQIYYYLFAQPQQHRPGPTVQYSTGTYYTRS